MATNFPQSVDDFPPVTGSTALNAAGDSAHATQHNNANDAIEAIEGFLLRNADPDIPPASANGLDDEFEDGGSIDGKWTKVNDPGGGDALSQNVHRGRGHGTSGLVSRSQQPAWERTVVNGLRWTSTWPTARMTNLSLR